MPAKTKEQRLFGAACLKVKLEARGVGAPELYESTLKDLELTSDEVEAYLAVNRDMVEAALEAHGQPRN